PRGRSLGDRAAAEFRASLQVRFDESDNIRSPDVYAAHTKTVTILSAETIGRVHPRLRTLAARLDLLAQDAVRRQVIVILGLHKKDGHCRSARSCDQSTLHIRRTAPCLSGSRTVHGNAIACSSLHSQHGLNA